MVYDEEYLLTCMRHMELNPVRADMVKSPGVYRWSSYGKNGLDRENILIYPYILYQALGRTRKQRMEGYKALFKAHIDDKDLGNIRASLQSGTPLGNDYFKERVEAKLKCKVGQTRRGRPKKGSDPL
ncbi:MAG: hypothetical protein OQL06_02385 [Gammaproteobacteria bacterium]|nr:hypothetical protein [Gammaproteobacteria bacterium]